MEVLATLQSQANRLAFVDPAMEERFRREQVEASLPRVRVLMVVSMLVVAGLGLQEVYSLSLSGFADMAWISFRYRFGGVLPTLGVLLISTGLPSARGRSDLVMMVGISTVVWGLALLRWHGAWYFEQRGIAQMVLLDLVVILIVAVTVLNVRLRSVVAMTVITVGGVVVFFRATIWGEETSLWWHFAGSAVGFTVVVILMQWVRERRERFYFAQREHLARVNTELSRLNQEQVEFMEIVAHDLRSPLAIVKTYAEMLEQGMSARQSSEKIYRQIYDQAEGMLSLVNNYLGVHAREAGEVIRPSVRVDLRWIAARVAQANRLRAEAKSQSIRVVPREQPVWVEVDVAMLTQVVENYLDNAFKFSPRETEIRMEVTVTVAGGGAGEWGRITVRDEGPGIPRSEWGQVFRKFGRTSVRPTGDETSHGLGLALVKVLASRLGARVGFNSDAGRGAAFWVELPLAISPGGGEAMGEAPASTS